MRLIKIIVNWLIIATLPVWGGTLFLGLILHEGLSVLTGQQERRFSEAAQLLAGDKFLWH